MKNNSKYVETIRRAIANFSKESGIDPSDVSRKMLEESTDVTDWDLRKAGGLDLVKKAYFPQDGKDLKGIHEAKKTKSYISTLENRIGSKESFEDQILEILNKTLKVLPKIKTKNLKFKNNSKDKVELVGMLNDTHIGLIVDPEEVGNGNSFDFKEACRRFALYTKQVKDYKSYKKNVKRKLNLVLNGDLVSGLIHSLDTKTIHLMIHQISAAIHIFTHVITNLSNEFNEIEIHGIAGNHCRSVHKNHGQRAVAEVYDSYANIIFYALSTVFRNNKQISFNFPKTPYGFINLPAGRAMYVHGDHIFSKALGNPGKNVNVKGISEVIKDFNAGEVAKGNKPVKLVLLAHVHTFAHFITNDGVEVYIAPSLVGLDQYAHSLSINNNFIAQVVFESTKDFILGDSRLIRLNEADKDVTLDKIIPIYNKELKWQK